MKRFMIKFYAMMAIILGVIGYYVWFVQPELSGDMGRIGRIPFGKEYNARLEKIYQNVPIRMHVIREDEEIADSIITIGDSFSLQFRALGYNNFLANSLGVSVSNITRDSYHRPEESFIRLVNNHKIPKGSIVIVESVERGCIIRLNDMNLETENLTSKSEVNNGDVKLSVLDETIAWLRLYLGIKNSIRMYKTSRDLFTHKTRHNELYIYDSRWDGDGDLRFVDNANESAIMKAWSNLYLLHKFAEEHGVTLIYMIAADKYDVYEPFIKEEHVKNPTLDKLPEEDWIVNSKEILQKKAYDGVQDLYYINDTHWSPVGAQIIGEEIAKRVQNVQHKATFE